MARGGHGARRACFFRNIQSGSRAAGRQADEKRLRGIEEKSS